MRLKKLGRSVIVGVLAGMLYGLWAVYANWNHGPTQAARAAVTQFALSFGSTSVLTLMIELFLARGRSAPNLVLAVVGPHVGMASVFLTIHWLAGTPNILKTIAPSVAIGLVFCIAYVLKRSRAPQDRSEPPGGVRTSGDLPGHEIGPAPCAADEHDERQVIVLAPGASHASVGKPGKHHRDSARCAACAGGSPGAR